MFYHFLFDIFNWSAAVAQTLIHLKLITLYIFIIFGIDFNFLNFLFYLLIFISEN